MPHISKQKLEKKLSEDIYLQLLNILIKNKGESGKHILPELLTETEQIMLAKRCAVIALLSKDVSHYRIWQMLKMSPRTIAIMSNACEAGKYRHMQKYFSSAQNKKSFWALLEKILQAGLPPRNNKRWEWLNEMDMS